MFSEELNKLIEASLVDGVLTDKERAVIRKRALLEGVDPDEVDLMLDAEIDKLRIQQESAVKKVKKCPNCGEVIPAMSVSCPSCGYEFRNSDVSKAVQELANRLNNAKYDTDRRTIIKNYPVPTSKEDIVELFHWALSNATGNNFLAGAWQSLCEQIILKAKYSMGDDKLLAADIERYENFKRQKRKRILTIVSAIGAIVLVIVLWFGISSYRDNSAKELAIKQGQEQCDSLCALIDNLPAPNAENYKEVEHKLLSITWKKINCPNRDIDEEVNGGPILSISPEGIIAPYLMKKRAYASQIYAVYKELFPGENSDSYYDGLEASMHAPKQIYDPDDNIEN